MRKSDENTMYTLWKIGEEIQLYALCLSILGERRIWNKRQVLVLIHVFALCF